MSSRSCIYESANTNIQRQSHNILAEHHEVKINAKFMFKIPKGSKNVSKEVRNSCKVLHFSSKWSYEELLSFIDRLDPKDYPQLFIFIIEDTNPAETATILHEKLLEFGHSRPIILQLTSAAATKIYYKENQAAQLIAINQQQNNFTTLLCLYLNDRFDNFEQDILDIISQLQDRSLILRFLQILKLSDGFFGSLILNAAIKGTESEFLAALDAPFDSDGRVLSYRAQQYISDVFGDDEDPANDDSVLLRAVENNNLKVIKYLVKYWPQLIQQLPFDHQVRVSTAAYESNQFDVLCDLLNVADFPFPNNFILDHVDNARLQKITAERIELKVAIEAENQIKIDKFINNNPHLKFIYNYDNSSALTKAANLKKFGTFFSLKSLGCRGENCQDILRKLSDDDQKIAKNQAKIQRKANVQKAQRHCNKSVLLLSIRSRLHKIGSSENQLVLYSSKIIKWLEDIYKIAPEIIDVAASCESLKIIFDCESNDVENVSLANSNATGSTYPSSKWIFIGAKLLPEDNERATEREQNIKGVLAHELCHYVMKLVYENNENPYFEHMTRDKEIFEEIVKAVDKWSSDDSEYSDDECHGVILSVFKRYSPADFHPELIVRAVHILAQFDDHEEHSLYLQQKYKRVFGFWENFVVPELQKYLVEDREAVRKLNRTFGFWLNNFEDNKIQLSFTTDLKLLSHNRTVIIRTNIPKLMIINICKHFYQTSGCQFDTKNLFVKPRKLANLKVLTSFKKLVADQPRIHSVIDCSKDVDIDWKSLKFNKDSNLVLIVSNEAQSKAVEDCLKECGISPKKLEINYHWIHLQEESQQILLETKVNFQNNSDLMLLELLKTKSENIKELQKICNKIVDDKFLNMLLDSYGSNMLTIKPLEKIEDQSQLDCLFQPRQFIKNGSNKMSQEEFVSEVKIQQFVVISDEAGSGKSWTMKNIAKILREQQPTTWVTYVDLKQFASEFKTQKGEPEFSSFMIEHILNQQHKFEAKIFQKMYKNGKVLILFDGFDEVYAEFAIKLAQNFQQNGGNQLWIATRDYFEVELMKSLGLDVTYKLNKMTIQEAINLIARSWMLMDFEKTKNEDFEKFTQTSQKLESYKHKARQIINKASILENHSVNLGPNLCKMIADGFKDDNNVEDLQRSEIFSKFVEIFHEQFKAEKDKTKRLSGTKSPSFFKFHRFHAIASLFPQKVKLLFPGFEFSDEKVIGCGLTSFRDGKIIFLLEIFRDFFVADFISNSLKMQRIDDAVVDVFVEVLVCDKFRTVRMFLNDFIDDSVSLKDHQNKLQKIYKIKNFRDFFNQNFQLGLMLIRSGSYEAVEHLLLPNLNFVIYENPEKFKKFQNFLVSFFKTDEIINLLIQAEILQNLLSSNLPADIFGDFIAKIEAKTSREFIRQGLILASINQPCTNIFYFLSKTSNLNPQKVQKLFQIIENFFTITEVFEMISKCNQQEENVLDVCLKTWNSKNFEILWTEIENYFAVQNFPQSYKQFVNQSHKTGQNVLFVAAHCSKLDVHETLWKQLFETFQDREELKNFILQKDKNQISFTHGHVICNRNPAVVAWTFKTLKENFSDAQFQEILDIKGWRAMNLLQTAAHGSNVVKVHKILWKLLQDFQKNDGKFMEMLDEVDELGENVLHIAAKRSSSEVFEFMINELQKFATRDEIRRILGRLSRGGQNLMQSAAFKNTSLKLHLSLWKTLQKFFDEAEILQFINNVDNFGCNLLFSAVMANTKEVVELTWREIKGFLSFDEQLEYLVMKNKNGKNLLECSLLNKFHKDEVSDLIKKIMK